MIYKPNTASPDMETVIPDNDRITFNVKGVSSSTFNTSRVGFKVDNKEIDDSYNDGFEYFYIDDPTTSNHFMKMEKDVYDVGFDINMVYKCDSCDHQQYHSGACEECGSNISCYECYWLEPSRSGFSLDISFTFRTAGTDSLIINNGKSQIEETYSSITNNSAYKSIDYAKAHPIYTNGNKLKLTVDRNIATKFKTVLQTEDGSKTIVPESILVDGVEINVNEYDEKKQYDDVTWIFSYETTEAEKKYVLQMNSYYFYIVSKSNRIEGLKPNTLTQWNMRLYEKHAFDEDDDINKFPFIRSADKRHGGFNYKLAYEDAAKSGSEKYKDSFYECVKYKPTSIIGYGTVQNATFVRNYTCTQDNKKKYSIIEVSSDSYVSNTLRNRYYVLKIFPHTFRNWDMGSSKLTKGYDSYYARYYIEINGITYKILDWKYYFWGYKYQNSKVTTRTFNSKRDTDGYDNPLAMYILIRRDNNETFSADLPYTIYCNYVDTDDYTFKYTDEPVVDFCDAVNPEDKMTFFKTQDEALINENAYTTKYSNINISGVYPQNGTYVSKYKVSLYQVSGNNKLTLINSTGYEFGQNINYLYDEFMNGKKYLLHFEIANSNGNILNYYRCIAPSYGLETKLIGLDTSVNRNNNSVVVDYSSLFSIAPKEGMKNGYEFIETDTPYQPYVQLYKNNSLTYDEIDGQGALSIDNHVSNIVIKLNTYFNGEICKIVDDDGNEYILKWDGIQFVYKTPNKELIYYPYEYEISDIESLEDNAWLSKMIENMESADINTDVPYVWNEALDAQIFNSDLYIHTEEPASEYWWSIVMYDNGIYFKNLTIGSDWVNISSDKEVL